MKEKGVDVCLIPTSDFHDSEYVSDYFKVREYFSAFTGSAGELIVSMDEAWLYTDSRYFVQAAMELSGSEINLMKIGEKNVLNEDEFIIKRLEPGMTLGFDGRLISTRRGMNFLNNAGKKGATIKDDFDPHEVMEDIPSMEFNPVYILGKEYSGESVESKLNRIYEKMKERHTDVMVISSLDEIAWITNLRGSDVECNPVFFSYLILAHNEAHLYANIEDRDVIFYLNNSGVYLYPYDDFFKEGLLRVNNWTSEGVWLDMSRTSYRIYSMIGKKLRVLNEPTAAYMMKMIKNPVEIENIHRANIMDGVALVKFEKWLSDSVNVALEGKGQMPTEMEVSDKLYEFRRENPKLVDLSFDTIAAAGEHGAIVHYGSTEATNIPLKSGSFLLIDSGGQYKEGTTDITRTYAIGIVDEKLKEDYTLVLRSMLKLLNLQFKYGARGTNLDTVVRAMFWEKGKDFGHSTGHGIGAFLNVHESPVIVNWLPGNGRPQFPFEPGMLTSDEPGLYIEGQYGIRIENDILCVDKYVNEYGRFLGFKAMTLCPIDTSCISFDDMNDEDISNLNGYHQLVYEELSPYFEGELLDYLKRATAPIGMK